MYTDLFKHFDAIARLESSRLCPTGYDVGRDAPQSLGECKAYFDRHGRILVSDDNSCDTIYNDPQGNKCFRAWHDWTHIHYGFEFDRVGEYATFRKQCEDMRNYDIEPERLAGLVNVLRCEIVGQFDYRQANGLYPQYQRAFTIDYLEGRY